MIHKLSIPVGSKSLEIEIGKLAKQADGAAVVRFGDTVVLATAVFAKEPKENADFFPLTVDYRENTYAAGRIPGGWFKREGRPTEKEILTSRLIDRPLRPLFPKGFNHETQIIAFVLSADGQNDPDVLALNGPRSPSRARSCPSTPRSARSAWGRSNGEFVLNPTNAEREKSEIDLIVAGTEDAVVMVEAGAREVSEKKMLDAILFGHEAVRRIVAAQKDLQRARRLPEARVAGARGLLSRGLRRSPASVGGPDAGGSDAAGQDPVLHRGQGREEGGGRRWFRRPRPSGASRRRKPWTTWSRS